MYIFDLDGTITDTNGIWQDVDLEFLARRGLTHTQEYQRVVERSIFPLAAQFTKEYYHLPESPQDIMSEWDAMAGLHYRELARLKPGAEDYLRQCRAVLDRFQLTDLFGHIVFAEEIGLEKRDPQCFVALGRLLGVPLGDCVLFDDSPDNCATAQKAGMTAVGVYDGYYAGRQEELKAACSRYILSFQELVRK